MQGCALLHAEYHVVHMWLTNFAVCLLACSIVVSIFYEGIFSENSYFVMLKMGLMRMMKPKEWRCGYKNQNNELKDVQMLCKAEMNCLNYNQICSHYTYSWCELISGVIGKSLILLSLLKLHHMKVCSLYIFVSKDMWMDTRLLKISNHSKAGPLATTK